MTNKKLMQRVGGRGIQLGEGVRLVNLKMSAQSLERMDQLAADVEKATGVKLTRAFLFREGARLLCIRFRRELEKAKRGELHAKKRKEVGYANQKEKEEVIVRRGSLYSEVRRRRLVGDYRSQSVPRSRQVSKD